MRAVRELLLSLGIVEDTQNFKGTVLGAKRSEKTLKVQLCIWVGSHCLFPALASDFPSDGPKSFPDGEVIFLSHSMAKVEQSLAHTG